MKKNECGRRLSATLRRWRGFWLKIVDPRRCQEGLTFVETVIVIAIIGIFATAVTVTAVVLLSKSRDAAAKSQMESLRLGLVVYYSDCGTFPTQEQGLAALRTKPAIEPVPEKWRGPYIDKEVPKDPWGRDYKYIVPSPAGDPYGIICYGADGVEGGEDENKDITSWN